MDTSKKYIKMCERAHEIQENKNQHYFGDYIVRDGVVRVVNGYLLNEGGNEYRAIHNIDDDFIEQWFMENYQYYIWLPRQDQLQEMVNIDKFICFKSGVLEIENYSQNEESIYYSQLTSFEQLWLAFVMQEKHNKVWNEDKQEWV